MGTPQDLNPSISHDMSRSSNALPTVDGSGDPAESEDSEEDHDPIAKRIKEKDARTLTCKRREQEGKSASLTRQTRLGATMG